LKSNIHKIVDVIQSEQLFQTIYDFLKTREQARAALGVMTEEVKNKVLLSYEGRQKLSFE
jgi:hypothetical protein